jgi:cyclophilin family peptidyl-prolyl cis-trans isomerase
MTRSFRSFAVLALALALATMLATACSTTGGGQVATSSSPSGQPASVAPSAAGGGCPTAQPPALPAGEKRVVTIETAKGTIAITVEADLSPIAAGNFVALAGCGFYDGVIFHRLVPEFVIQGGDPTGTGTGGPGYEIKDEPVIAKYGRGTVAMARTPAPDSVGSQFFVVLSDQARSALESANTYQIIGAVTTGMDVVDAIAAMPNSGDPNNAALEPVAMDKVTVSTP